MGSIISNDANRNELLKRSNVKLQAQQVSVFNGNALKWHAWKKKTRAAIGTAGMLKILDEQIYANRNIVDNETVFHLLQVATADGNAAHLVDKHEDERDGNAAYQELVKWYEGDELTTETAEDVREKLSKISLSSKTFASQYINEFLQYTKYLDDLGESYTESKTVSIFLQQINDPDYLSTVEACHMNKYDIHTCIEQVRSKERRLTRERSGSRKGQVTIRRNGNHHDEGGPEILVLKNYKNDAGFYAIPNEKWQSLTEDDRKFVKSFNGKLRREMESTNGKRYISPKRNHAKNETEDDSQGNEPPTKKLKTVGFKDDLENQSSQATSDSGKNITNKRATLSFSVKDK